MRNNGGRVEVFCDDSCRQSIVCGIRPLDDLVDGVELENTLDRSEYFFPAEAFTQLNKPGCAFPRRTSTEE